jgi:hypothetical protein
VAEKEAQAPQALAAVAAQEMVGLLGMVLPQQ